jgi:Kef-type K+ transport system membrane component KefB
MEYFITDLGLILCVTAGLSCLAVFFKQPVIVAYILAGVLIGPWGFQLIKSVAFIDNVAHIGITLLLFLAGLNLHPQKLLSLFKKTIWVTLVNCVTSFGVAFGFSRLFRFSVIDSLCIGLALMFSSTILVVKLLPTTDLHQKRMGAMCIGVLIMEDLLAIGVLAFIQCLGAEQGALISFTALTLKLVVFIGTLLLVEQFVLRRIMMYVEHLHELLFVLGLAWCFGIAMISNAMGLFYETGAFFAGVVVARHPISLFISEKLKPLRDFFLVLFFFTLGAKLNLLIIQAIFVPALLLAVIFILLKPWLFQKAFILAGETPRFSQEIGVRLGQLSEFSLLVAIMALNSGQLTDEAAQLIKVTTIITFIISCYITAFKYSTPISPSEKLIRD